MRITGGKQARRILKVPKGLEVRPTPDLVKQAVFNSLGNRVVGARVLELFAGTGALSLECLSRGAVSAVCIEKSERASARAGCLHCDYPIGRRKSAIRSHSGRSAVWREKHRQALDLIRSEIIGRSNIARTARESRLVCAGPH